MDKLYDVIIIGGGPCGYSAGLYATRAGLDTLVIEKMSPGGQMTLTGDIDNYPGFDQGIDGFTLGMQMQKGAERFGAKTEYAQVTAVDFSEKIKKITTTSGDFYGKTVIIATGANPKKLGLLKENELTGKGVHYCAHCDGRFYKGKKVAVIGGGNSAAADALYLANLCEKVYLIHRRDSLRASRVYHQPIFDAENIEIIWDSQAVELSGDGRLSGITLENTKTAEKTNLTVDAIFVSIGREPQSELFRDFLDIDPYGYIIADETTKTNASGVFASGDVRTKALRQVVTACADGAVSAHFAEEYLI